MKKCTFVRTVLSFRDVYSNLYRVPFLCTSFPSVSRIEDVALSVLHLLPDNNIVWSSLKIKMSFEVLSDC